jgi:hypothetical protein
MPLPLRLDYSTQSALNPDQHGKLELRLVQSASGQPLIGTRLALTQAQAPLEPTDAEVHPALRDDHRLARQSHAQQGPTLLRISACCQT